MKATRCAGAAFVLLLVCAGPALALDNAPGAGGSCTCICSTSTGMNVFMNYASQGFACGAFENRTCNVEDDRTGLMATGSTMGCTRSATVSGISGAVLQNPGNGSAAPTGVPQQLPLPAVRAPSQ